MDKLLDELDKTLGKKQEYIAARKSLIQEIDNRLNSYISSADKSKQIATCLELVYEYQSFIYDSAFHYVEQAKSLAYEINDPFLIAQTKTKEGFVLLSSGLFKEAIDTLKSVDISVFDDSLKSDYYSTIARAYYDLADYGRDPVFMEKHIAEGNRYLDSALNYISPNTNEFWAAESLHRMKKSDWRGAKFAFSYWMNNYDLPRHYYAIATSSLGYIYSITGYPDLAMENLAKAAIADVKTATMETVALRNLANLLFTKGENKRAYTYISEALDDANFYNARQRQLEIGQILPIIERERINNIKSQRDTIIFVSGIIFVLLIALIIALVIIRRSLKRLNIARLTILDANDKLTEANKIKDEYIAYFFNQNSEFIEKFEKLQKWVIQKVAARQYSQLKNFPETLDVHKEREALFERFDQIFLKLFPDFVAQFNKLLKPEEQIVLKENELLNSDLRIYALIRLGINDNEKIASFLDYSVNTIYAYKTKIKGKANCPSEIFKQKVLEIKSI